MVPGTFVCSKVVFESVGVSRRQSGAFGARRRMESAPKGRNKPAQGNALGSEARCDAPPLKGRNNRPSCHELLRPFRAGNPRGFRFPRALPWADLFQPFGLKSRCACRRAQFHRVEQKHVNNAPEESRTRAISFERSYNPLSDGRRPTTAPIGYSLPALTGAFSGLFACPSAWTVAFGTTGGGGGDGVAGGATVAAGSGLNETTATACGITRQITPWSSHAASTPDERTGHLGIGKTGLVHPSASASWIPSLRIPGNDRKRRRSQRPRLFHTPAGCSTCRRFSAESQFAVSV